MLCENIYNVYMPQQPFPEWSDTLTSEQVISVLTDLQRLGHTIVFGRPPVINGWTIVGSTTSPRVYKSLVVCYLYIND